MGGESCSDGTMAATLVGPRTNAVEHFHAVLQPHQQITGIRHSAFQGIARILGTQEEKGGGVGGEGGSGRGREKRAMGSQGDWAAKAACASPLLGFGTQRW